VVDAVDVAAIPLGFHLPGLPVSVLLDREGCRLFRESLADHPDLPLAMRALGA
jgi:hypothetical protein